MDGPQLINFPLPLATALLCGVLAVLVWRLELGVRHANLLFSAFFGLGAAASLLVGLRFGYGIEELIPLQRTLPLFLGPLMYLGFASMAVEERSFPTLALYHLGAPFFAMGVILLLDRDLRTLDWAIIASYAFYSFALISLWRRGPDALSLARVDVTRSLSNWLLRGIGFLLFNLLLDGAITIDFTINNGANATKLISYGTIPLILLLLAALIALPRMIPQPRTVPASEPETGTADTEIVERLQALMRKHQLYLDPNITVQRLARRLGLPSRNVSAAVNRTQGISMSQYVNTFRLTHAAQLLAETDESVTKIATRSGFLTRSNFYREFQRAYAQSPTKYRTHSNA